MRLNYSSLFLIVILFLVACQKNDVIPLPAPPQEMIALQSPGTSLVSRIGIPNTFIDTIFIDGFTNQSYAENLLLLNLQTTNSPDKLWCYLTGASTSDANTNSKIEIATTLIGGTTYTANFSSQTLIDSTKTFTLLSNTALGYLIPDYVFDSTVSTQSPWLPQYRSSSYVSGYIGYRVTNKYGRFYGWLQLNVSTVVSTSGDTCKVMIPAFARYDVPADSIYAGQTP